MIDYRPAPEINDRCRQVHGLKVYNATVHPKMKNACDGAVEVYLKSEADQVIAKLKAVNEWLRVFRDELVKDCKWLPTTITPDKNGFETMVQCTNGKKRVASFCMFDFCWYDVNNGNKLNIVKWLWQPSMPSDKEKT